VIYYYYYNQSIPLFRRNRGFVPGKHRLQPEFAH
jgi:hypothetical protein